MHIFAVMEKELDDGSVAVLGCHLQRLIVVSMHICAVLDEEPHHISVTIRRCLQCIVVESTHVCAVL